MRQLLEAGVHFGHQTRRWNPKMRPFIFAERNGIHIIDLAQTVQRLDVALEAVRDTVARGDQVLFVGTKKQAQEPIAAEAIRAGQPYVNRRWLGGMLTNFTTIKKRIGLLEQLEARQGAGDFERMTKKEAAKLTEEMIKLQATVGGMRKMKRLPGAIFIVDPHRERIAVTRTSTPTSSISSFPPTTMRSGRSACCARWSPRRPSREAANAAPERRVNRRSWSPPGCPRPRRKGPPPRTRTSRPWPVAPRSPSSRTRTRTTCCPAIGWRGPKPPLPKLPKRRHLRRRSPPSWRARRPRRPRPTGPPDRSAPRPALEAVKNP
jgi:small subunit ribosomal protein S2